MKQLVRLNTKELKKDMPDWYLGSTPRLTQAHERLTAAMDAYNKAAEGAWEKWVKDNFPKMVELLLEQTHTHLEYDGTIKLWSTTDSDEMFTIDFEELLDDCVTQYGERLLLDMGNSVDPAVLRRWARKLNKLADAQEEGNADGCHDSIEIKDWEFTK
ncbi:MAG: hypothetical protein ACXWWG_00525 [Nitrospira sp.]